MNCVTAFVVAMVAAIGVAPMAHAKPLTLDEAVRLAHESNPALAAQRATVQAMREIPSQAGALPDPVVTLNAANLPVDSYSFADENMTQKQVGVMQKIPFPGKLGLQEEAAQHRADQARWERRDFENQLVRQVRDGWWGLFFLDRGLETIRKNRDLMRQLVRIAESKYSLGAGLQQDALLAQLELTRLIDREQELTSARERATARLNGLLGRDPLTPLVLPRTVDETLPPLKEGGMLVTMAGATNPKLSASDASRQASSARLAHAQKGYLPDFTLGATYGIREDNPATGQPRSDLASFSLAMSIPLWGGAKQSRAIAQREHEVEAEKWRRDDTKNEIAVAVATYAADYRRARQRAALYRTGIIPLAIQTVASMEAGYQVNKVDFLNVVRARISLYNDEIEYWKSLATAHRATASLMAAVGGENIYE